MATIVYCKQEFTLWVPEASATDFPDVTERSVQRITGFPPPLEAQRQHAVQQLLDAVRTHMTTVLAEKGLLQQKEKNISMTIHKVTLLLYEGLRNAFTHGNLCSPRRRILLEYCLTGEEEAGNDHDEIGIAIGDEGSGFDDDKVPSMQEAVLLHGLDESEGGIEGQMGYKGVMKSLADDRTHGPEERGGYTYHVLRLAVRLFVPRPKPQDGDAA